MIIALLKPGYVYAQSGDPIISSSVEYVYGENVNFTLLLSDDAPVTDVQLFIQPLRAPVTLVQSASLTETSDGIRASVQVQENNISWRPFSPVEYSWQITLEDGQVITSPSYSFDYVDNREFWSFLEGENIRVYWQVGDLEFGQMALDIAYRGIADLLSTLALPTNEPIILYIYPTRDSLYEALELAGSQLVSGHTFSDYGVVLLFASDDQESLIQLERDIPHELTHAVIAQRMGAAYDRLPGWLSEGLATLQEGSPDNTFPTLLEDAYKSDSLLPISSLCSSFPFTHEQARLAYAQSASFVSYIKDIYGVGAFSALFDAYSEDISCQGGIQRVFQRPIEQLEAEWIDYSFADGVRLQQPSLLWVFLIFALVLLAGFVGYRYRRRKITSQEESSKL